MHFPTTPHLDPVAPTAAWAGLIAALLIFTVFAAAALVGAAHRTDLPENPPGVSSVGAAPRYAQPLT